MSSHSQEPARELPETPDLSHLKGHGKDLLDAGLALTPAKTSRTAAQTVIGWLRWAAVLGLVAAAWVGFLYDVLHNGIGFYSCALFLFVAAVRKIVLRNRRTTAIVLAAVLVHHSFWGHVLAMGGPWWSWTINYTHFTQEALGAVLGVVYIFWSEQAKESVASVPPDPPPP